MNFKHSRPSRAFPLALCASFRAPGKWCQAPEGAAVCSLRFPRVLPCTVRSAPAQTRLNGGKVSSGTKSSRHATGGQMRDHGGVSMDYLKHNRPVCSRQSGRNCIASLPVDSPIVAKARHGDREVILTPSVPVPRAWFGDLRGRRMLRLSSGGGQQAPVLAAAGAKTVSFDLSEEQLAKDAMVAERDGLPLDGAQGWKVARPLQRAFGTSCKPAKPSATGHPPSTSCARLRRRPRHPR